MRYLYTFLFYLALPFVFLRLLWRSRRLKAYRSRLSERLGFYSFSMDKCLWVHAVSVGETIAAVPLIKKLKELHPQIPILVTTMTPTGAARVQAAFGESVTHLYIPYDLPGAMKRFLKATHPMVCVMMETELWPNLLAACARKKIPVCLVNARLSGKSARGYARVASLTREMLNEIDVIASQGEKDAERFIALGAPKKRVIVTGNLKFDMQLPTDLADKAVALRKTLGENRLIWVAASTHEGEEEIILKAQQLIREKIPNALLILVPRHPDRFDVVANLCAQTSTVRRSSGENCDANTSVYLGDTMGEMLLMYSVADAAFVAGSLIERGGHNILEPAALAKPIITGPYIFNFQEICDLFVSEKAQVMVNDAETLANQVIALLQDEALRKNYGDRALRVIQANRGALDRQVELIEAEVSKSR